jgi:hypothetical protein
MFSFNFTTTTTTATTATTVMPWASVQMLSDGLMSSSKGHNSNWGWRGRD